jgi:pimeloyl-ACP methyl ester carboxylesterase
MPSDGIIFIHAFPLDSSMWDAQVRTFGKETKVLAANLPGFGGAPGAGDVMTMEAAAKSVSAQARQAGITNAVVVGLSMGGYVALELWRQQPGLVAGLVLANTRADADDAAAKERRAGLANRLKSEGNGFMVESPPPLLSEGASPALLQQVKGIIAKQPAASIAGAALGMAERPDSTADLARIDVPTLVITSTADTLIPPSITKNIADGVKGSRYEVIDGVGHLSNLEAPDKFNALLAGHVKQV